MTLDTTTDYAQVKRFNSVEIEIPAPTASFVFDHFRLRMYKLLDNGADSLVFESDPFDGTGAGPVSLEFGSVNDPASFVAAIDDNSFYRLEVISFDAGESAEQPEDEHFLHAIPDEVKTTQSQTTGTGGTGTGTGLGDSIDSLAIEKSLTLSGHNTLHGEFDNASGYTVKRIIRGYAELTDAEAEALLDAAENPGEAEIIFKHETLKTVSDIGNEQAAIAREVPIA